jgi:hypothetical protein
MLAEIGIDINSLKSKDAFPSHALKHCYAYEQLRIAVKTHLEEGNSAGLSETHKPTGAHGWQDNWQPSQEMWSSWSTGYDGELTRETIATHVLEANTDV